MTFTTRNELEQFRAGNEEVMKQIYLLNKPKFLGFFQKELASSDIHVEDLYQESFCVLHKGVMSQKIEQVSSTWGTLLIGIGKNLARNELKKKAEVLSDRLPELAHLDTPVYRVLLQEKAKRTKSILNLVGQSCRDVLVHFYYHEQSMQEIAEKLGYASANAAKKKKSVCLKKLREQVKKYGIDQ